MDENTNQNPDQLHALTRARRDLREGHPRGGNPTGSRNRRGTGPGNGGGARSWVDPSRGRCRYLAAGSFAIVSTHDSLLTMR